MARIRGTATEYPYHRSVNTRSKHSTVPRFLLYDYLGQD